MSLSEPSPPDPIVPRYSTLSLPPYRFVPGLNPHPRVDPAGHSWGLKPEALPPWRLDEWRDLEAWLYAVDLYNQAYWWESHEVLEALWHAAGRRGEAASFVHGILHVAVASLNRHRGKTAGARRQAEKALKRLAISLSRGGRTMGLDVIPFAAEVRGCFITGSRPQPPAIRLDWSD